MEKQNKLTAINIDSKTKGGHQYWIYKCSCGNFKKARKDNVDSGSIRSCGCLKKECLNPLFQTKFYRAYYNLLQRCNNPKNERFKNYGGRGIKVHWASFNEFKNDMYNSFTQHEKNHGGRNTTIERIDNDGDYCLDNCRWATMKEQYLNRTHL